MPREKRRMAFTDRSIRALQPEARRLDYFDAAGALPGFGLRVTANGVKTWTVLYRNASGRLRRLTLGKFPLVGLADAREMARKALASVVQGADPAGEKQARREAPTFAEVAREYVEHAKKVNRSWREKQRMLDTDVIPAWGSRQARDITARDVRELVDGIVDRGAPIAANRTFALIGRVFTWASAPDRGLVPQHHNPCRGMERPAPEKQRARVLDASELRSMWAALDSEDVYNAALFRLYLLTAQRGGELRTMEWAELDLASGWWTVPADKAKNGIAHRVPLSPQAVAILSALPRVDGSPWIFPSTRAAKGCRSNITKAVARIRKAGGVDFWPHDLRRTAASHMTSMGISRLTVGKILNHVERGITAVYDRHSYDAEKQAALVAWGAKLDAIVHSDASTAKVIPLRA